MEILVTEQREGIGRDVVCRLRAAGHAVVGCSSRSELCAGLDETTACPFDSTPPSLTVAVREGGPELSQREFGVLCSIRAHVPVAEVGPPEPSPIERHAVLVDDAADIDAVADLIAGGRRRDSEAVVRRALWSMPELAAVPGHAVGALVLGRSPTLAVSIVVPDWVPSSLHEALAARSERALRAADRSVEDVHVRVTTGRARMAVPAQR